MLEQWIFQAAWLGNSVFAWMLAVAGVLLGYLLVRIAVVVAVNRLARLAGRNRRFEFAVAAAVLRATRGWLLLLIAISTALGFLHWGSAAGASAGIRHGLRLLLLALIGLQLAFWISTLLVEWLRAAATRNDARATNPVMLGVLTWLARFIVWVVLALALLATGGINITAFVASLGIGGVAIALALQNILGDLFASVSIGLDKPFDVGEFIAFGDEMGTVIKVGIKSTRIRALSGEELAISNSVLLKNLIHNHSRRQERRVVFTLRLPFDTAREKIPATIDRVRAIVTQQQRVRFERGYLSGFGDSGLELEFVYNVLDPDYNVFVAVQQNINLAILSAFDELGVEFAVPARSIRAVRGDNGPGAALANR